MTAPVLCAHCQAPVRGRSPAEPQPLCRRELSVAWSGPECAVLVEDWGHPGAVRGLCGVGGAGGRVAGVGVAGRDVRCQRVDDVMEAVTWQ